MFPSGQYTLFGFYWKRYIESLGKQTKWVFEWD